MIEEEIVRMFVIDVEVVAYVKSFLSLFNSASPSRRLLVMADKWLGFDTPYLDEAEELLIIALFQTTL